MFGEIKMSASNEIIYGIELRMPGEKLQNLGYFKLASYCSQSTSLVFFHWVENSSSILRLKLEHVQINGVNVHLLNWRKDPC